MAIKIHAFDTDADFQAAYNGSAYTEPWVSYTRANESVKYNKSEYEKLLATPLTFEITSNGVIKLKAENASVAKTVEYSKNGGEWTTITSSTGASAPAISVVSGDTVQFRGNNSTYANNYSNGFSDSTCWFTLKGNIMSLISSDNFVNATTLADAETFSNLFARCSGLTDASKLLLPATTLTEKCYYALFNQLPNLVYGPLSLPATTLANQCYKVMFLGCTSLTNAPELPATELAKNCYGQMFQGCTSLTTAPELPATTLDDYCYQHMFSGCTSLSSAPELPATTLKIGCYQSMFLWCTSLTNAPELPATELANSCYNFMFQGCTSLTTAPELPATTLANHCYSSMFNGCTNLNYIKCLATNISALGCLNNWVVNVQTTSGTFVKNPNMSSWQRGTSGIPVNWTVQDA